MAAVSNSLKATGTVRPLLALTRKRTRLRRELRHVTVTSEERHTTLNLRTPSSGTHACPFSHDKLCY